VRHERDRVFGTDRGECDPARPDSEFECASASGKLDEQIDGRLHDRRVEHFCYGLVVPRGDAPVEVAVVVHPGNVPHHSGAATQSHVILERVLPVRVGALALERWCHGCCL
jgi:hypothetical protein